MITNKPRLAFLIPAFEASRLRDTLVSLASQTDRDFRIYIADDASSEPLEEVAGEFGKDLDIRYVRFEDNLGKTSLSAHQKRSLDLVEDEPFVCMFSEGNTLTKNAVKRLYRTIDKHQEYDVYHWLTESVRDNGEVSAKAIKLPKSLGGRDLFRLVFIKHAKAPMSSFVFRSDVLLRDAVFDPSLYRTDLQTIFNCAYEHGVRVVGHERLEWRRHVEIGGRSPVLKEKIASSMLSFFHWSESFFEAVHPLRTGEFLRLLARWAVRLYPSHTASEVRDTFMEFNVCKQGPVRILRRFRADCVLNFYFRRRKARLRSTGRL